MKGHVGHDETALFHVRAYTEQGPGIMPWGTFHALTPERQGIISELGHQIPGAKLRCFRANEAARRAASASKCLIARYR